MSVQYQTFLLFGWDIGYGDVPRELVEDYHPSDADEGDVVVVRDGRSGLYCYLGVLVTATNPSHEGPQSFSYPRTIPDPAEVPNQIELGKVVGEYCDDSGVHVSGDAEFHLFTHVT